MKFKLMVLALLFSVVSLMPESAQADRRLPMKVTLRSGWKKIGRSFHFSAYESSSTSYVRYRARGGEVFSSLGRFEVPFNGSMFFINITMEKSLAMYLAKQAVRSMPEAEQTKILNEIKGAIQKIEDCSYLTSSWNLEYYRCRMTLEFGNNHDTITTDDGKYSFDFRSNNIPVITFRNP